MGGTPFNTTTKMMDNKQLAVSGNGSGQKNPRQLNRTYIQEDNIHYENRHHSGSNASVRIKIGAILMELWHF
jgi:hypothetical protein